MSESPPKSRLKPSVALPCALMLIASAILSYSAAQRHAPTFDEPLHAAAGYLIRWLGDYRLDAEDPALFTLLSTLPHRASDLHVSRDDPAFGKLLDDHDAQWDVVMKMMFRTPLPSGGGNYSGVRYIQKSRVIFVLISLALGGLIAWWAYRLAGTSGALIATALFAFDPNILAHGALVKNDVPISLALLWMMYATWLIGQRVTINRFVSLLLACAVAVNIKFSGPVLVGIAFLSLLIRATLSTPWIAPKAQSQPRVDSPVRRDTKRSVIPRLMFALTICATITLFCWASIWAVYGFRYSLSTDPAKRFDREVFVAEAKMRELIVRGDASITTPSQFDALPNSFPVRAMLWIDDHRLCPHAWTMGLFYTYKTSLTRNAFLLGGMSEIGWWYYFPVAMFFKTPVATLIAMIVISIIALRALRLGARPQGGGIPDGMKVWKWICLGLPIAIYGFSAMRANLNLGIRHILPIYPFIYLLLAVGFSHWIARWRGARIVTITLLIGTGAETLVRWPHEIAFFNLLAGGPGGGIGLLGDSNLDWGQDLPLVAQWQEQHPDTPLYLAYFGSVDPKAYGIRYIHVGAYPFSDQPVELMDKPGVFAISATHLQGIYYPDSVRQKMQYLRQRQPMAILGNSIYLYDWRPEDFRTFSSGFAQP